MRSALLLLLVGAVLIASPAVAAQESGGSNETFQQRPSDEASLDDHAVIEDYRLSNGTMVVDVRLDRETTIYATETVKQEGVHTTAFEQFRYLQPGSHSLEIDTIENESAAVLLYTGRGIENGRAKKINVNTVSDGLESRSYDWALVGLVVLGTVSLWVLFEALKARLGVDQRGEKIA